MEPESQALIEQIEAAFGDRAMPEGAAVFHSSSFEVDMAAIESRLRDSHWRDFPQELVKSNPLALFFATPAAFAWLLPAFLRVSIAHYAETDTLTTSILTCLTPPDPEDAAKFKALVEEMRQLDPDLLVDDDMSDVLAEDEESLQAFRERVVVLTPEETRAVREYLEYVERVHGADFPEFGPRRSLERYWDGAVA